MFDIGWSELLTVAVVAVIVVGPRELPGMLRTLGRTIRQVKQMAGDFQHQFSDALRESEIDELRRSVNDAGGLKDSLNPVKSFHEELKRDIMEPVPGTPGPESTPESTDETVFTDEPSSKTSENADAAGEKTIAASENLDDDDWDDDYEWSVKPGEAGQEQGEGGETATTSSQSSSGSETAAQSADNQDEKPEPLGIGTPVAAEKTSS